MNINRQATIVRGLYILGLLVGSAAWAQVTPQRLNGITSNLRTLKQMADKFPEAKRRMLSGSAQNAFQVAEVADRFGLQFPDVKIAGTSVPLSRGRLTAVSNPGNDFGFSVMTGFTQSETSTAWCGQNVVVGFNDSGSLPESVFFGPGGLSFNGVAQSSNAGNSFTDLGFLNPGPNPGFFLGGDPVIGCTSSNTFYYSSILLDFSSNSTDVSVSRSRDGGVTWGDPVPAASKSLATHFLDKDWMAVDPNNPQRLYVTYTDFDFSGVCGVDQFGNPEVRIAIELVRSTNGGTTWSSPVVLDEVCSPATGPGAFVQGSQVVVGPAGEVYVAWEFFQPDFYTRELRIRKSTHEGIRFSPFVKISDLVPIGDGFAIQANFRNFLDIGPIAVDRSGTRTNGNLYVSWHDGRNLQVFDFESGNGVYAYADVLLSKSTNRGETWSAPVRVNNNVEPLSNGRGTDQYQPGAAVDKTGKVAVCWYDRRLDPFNYLIDRFCGESTDAGQTWTNERVSSPSWPPIHAVDAFINTVYLGDYDSLASDTTEGSAGFIGAFQVVNTKGVFVPNPDVKAAKLP